MISCARLFDYLLRPNRGLRVLQRHTKHPWPRRDRGGGVEIAVVGRPPEGGAEVG